MVTITVVRINEDFSPLVSPHSLFFAAISKSCMLQKQANESSSDVLYLLGGDTYDGDTSARSQLPGVLDMKWEVGYKNDGEFCCLLPPELHHVSLCICGTSDSPVLISCFADPCLVWKMTGTEWALHGDPRLRGAYHQKIPKVESKVKWDSVQQVL